uniref:hypothetical protein n=1 Tax=Neorhizobium sp. EC2-8 TaxID=3129230 RepID=UPI003100B971
MQLPKPSREAAVERPAITNVLQAGAELGFVSREATTRRKPGPRRIEAQDKITVTGPKRVIDRLKAYSDAMGGVSYCEAIDALLNAVEAKGK